MDNVQTAELDGAKTRHVYLVLRERILDGTYQPGDRLPGENHLAESFGVSRVTIRRALDALQQDEVIDRQRGRGTIVRDQAISIPPMPADFANLWSQLADMGARSQVRLLAFNYVDPSPSIARLLKLEQGIRTQLSVRVRSVDGAPFSHLTTHVPESLASRYSADDITRTPLFALLERSGAKVTHARQTITATLASKDVADALHVDVGSALLSLTRTVFDGDGNGVEHLTALYRPDRYRFEMDLTRVGEDESRQWVPDGSSSGSRAEG